MALLEYGWPTEAEAEAFAEGIRYHSDERIGVEEIVERPENSSGERWVVVVYDATEDEE